MQTPDTLAPEATPEIVASPELLVNAMRRDTVPDKNLDMIRNILFGEQLRDLERKNASLERFVRVSINALAEDTQRKLDTLQNDIRLIKDLLIEEAKARREEHQGARHRLEKNERFLDELAKRVTTEVAKLDQQMELSRKDLIRQLTETAEQLRHEKADRKAVAGILNGMAKQLFDVEKIEAL
ncbi:hypothetical protein [Thiothrix eikelboomii]|uniref:Uncharacterized protein n=1 Tax=Thiothrix eikelboomii TaxID=92487 RepID=A0A1T4VY26_9GAMM|nr:hypothetical protein [Thiothrix eikelboomii]SKA69401.1 hypothetical protein SAMN02745130_00462 [Thiothrix eikelboomii]